MGRRILVTGGAGFIGSHLCERLLTLGNYVICLDNLIVGSLKNLENFSKNKNFKFVKGDVRSKDLVEKLVRESDIIYHLAAIVGVSAVVKNRSENISVNIEGTKILAEAAFKLGKKKVIFTSSSEVYGKNTEVPLSEDTSNSVFGSTRISRWAYGLAKSIGEHILLDLSEKGLPFSIVRYFNSYGPRGWNNSYANVVPKFIMQALKNENITVYGDGEATRCFCYVSDTVEGTILAEKNRGNQIFNIGSNHEININDLAKLIKRLTNSKSLIVRLDEKNIFDRPFESSPGRVPDIFKANNLLKFEPRIDLKDGLKKTINWIRKSNYLST